MMSGPEATAGSMWIFLKNSGMQVPTALEISIASSSAMPMQAETENANIMVFPLNKKMKSPMTAKDRTPSRRPLQKPMRISLKTSCNFCFPVRDSSIRTRMVTARDWVPTFPAISRIRDWKVMMIGRVVTTCSKIPTTEETSMPRPSRMISHGRRFFILSFNGSFKSSSAVRPANIA